MQATLFKILGTVAINTGGAVRDLRNVSSEADNARRDIAAAARMIGGAALKIGSAVGGVGVAALTAGDRFGQSMSTIRARTGATGPDIQRLERNVRDLALTQGRFNTTQINGALKGLARQGRSTDEMFRILEHGMVLAKATGNDLGTSANLLGLALDKAGKDSASAARYMHVFTQLMYETNMSIYTLKKNIVDFAPTMNAWNISLEQASGWLARLYQEGVYGKQATSGLGYIFRDLANITPEMAARLREMGVDVFDANDNFRDGYDILNELKGVMGDMTDVELAEFIQELFGANQATRAVLDALLNTTDGAEEFTARMYEAAQGTLYYGVAVDGANEQTGGLADAFGLVRHAGSEFLYILNSIIGEPIYEWVKEAAKGMVEFVKRFQEGGDLHPYIVELGEAFLGLIEALGEIIRVITPIVLEWLPVAIRLFTELVNWLSENTWAIEALVVALVGLKVIKVIKTLFNGFKGILTLLIGKKGMAGLKKAITGLVGKKGFLKLKGAIKILVGKVGFGLLKKTISLLVGKKSLGKLLIIVVKLAGKAGFGLLKTAITVLIGKKGMAKLKTAVTGLVGKKGLAKLKTAVVALAGKLGLGKLKTAVVALAGKLGLGKLKTAVTGLVGKKGLAKLKTAVVTLAGKLGLGKLKTAVVALAGKPGLGKLKTAVTGLVGKKGFGKLKDGITTLTGKGGLGKLKSTFSTTVGKATGGKGLLGGAKKLLGAIGPKGWAVLGIGAGAAFVANNWEDLREGSSVVFNSVRDNVAESSERIRENLTDNWQASTEETYSSFGQITHFVGNSMKDIAGEVATVSANVAEDVREWADGTESRILRWGGNMYANVIETGGNILSNVMEWGGGVVTSASENWETFYDNTRRRIREAADRVAETGSNIVSNVVEWGGNVVDRGVETWNNFRDGIRNARDRITDAAQSITDRVRERFENARDRAVAWGQNIGNRVRDGLQNVRQGVRDMADSIRERIQDRFENARDRAIVWGQNVGNRVREGLQNARQNVRDMAESIRDRIQNRFEAARDRAETWGRNIGNRLRNGLQSVRQNVRDMADSIRERIQNRFENARDRAEGWGSSIGRGVRNGLSSMRESITSTVSNIATGIGNTFRGILGISSPSRVFEQFGENIGQGFLRGIPTYFEQAVDLLKDYVGEMEDEFKLLSNAGAFGGLTVEGTARLTRELPPNPASLNSGTSANPNRNPSIGNQDALMNTLIQEVRLLRAAMSGMQVTMNDRVVVGQIRSQMDRQMGLANQLRDRGVTSE